MQMSSQAMKHVLLHEMCHVAVYQETKTSDGSSDCHGPLFQKWLKKALEKFPDIPKTADPRLTVKYTAMCGVCENM